MSNSLYCHLKFQKNKHSKIRYIADQKNNISKTEKTVSNEIEIKSFQKFRILYYKSIKKCLRILIKK